MTPPWCEHRRVATPRWCKHRGPPVLRWCKHRRVFQGVKVYASPVLAPPGSLDSPVLHHQGVILLISLNLNHLNSSPVVQVPGSREFFLPFQSLNFLVLASPGSPDSLVLTPPGSHNSPVLASQGSQLYMTIILWSLSKYEIHHGYLSKDQKEQIN